MDLFLSEALNDALDILRVNNFIDIKNETDLKEYHFHLKNDMCDVFIRDNNKDDYYYEVRFKYKDEFVSSYSDTLNIYWLIGFLTHNKLMKRDYKTP